MLNLQTLTNIHEGCTINNKLKVCICNLKCYIPCMLLKSKVLLFYDNNMSAINNLLSSITKTIQVTYVPSVDVFPPKFIPVPPNPPKPTSKIILSFCMYNYTFHVQFLNFSDIRKVYYNHISI